MSTESVQGKELLGYTLKQRIGAGGYGEVWSAEAPGGFAKAVKLVYGYHDDKRAQTELKAMDRIKQVRHPFLLSLERIEVFEGQLVVVSELADKSLADLFDEYTQAGEPGIPRDELIRYIRDAAEGLDYLSETHSLQHLDIKPENLLIVSGHIKVADFGLVKDLQDASQSLMTGMTPAYAAPELFDGKPCGSSDQYSLAIVYQEMLTAVRPFPGTTPAQLAAQHMHGRPNLRLLPKGDQFVIAKALSKVANVRFPSCLAMVDELVNSKLNKKRFIRRVTMDDASDACNTLSFDHIDNRDVTSLVSQSAFPFASVEISTLDPPDCDASQAEFRPTMILGVGNVASQAVQKIKQRLILRHGNMGELPAIQFRCFDSDRQSISQLTLSGEQSTLTSAEAVDLPLRKPEFYRDKAQTDLGWLPRRWIYNVPRSLQTEGLRPLGRLAFADHFEKICYSIQRAINEIIKVENIATTAENIGISPAEKLHPRVFIVTSISGGIGSGMTLDLAYLVKTLLAEKGLPIDSVSGILLHCTNQRARDTGLSNANAISFMTEMRHFNDYGYPGDATLGLPEFQDEPPLDDIYFLDLGLDVNRSDFENELDKIAEYIYLNCASTCATFFDECRKLKDEADHFSLRTFGMSVCGPGNSSLQGISNSLARELVHRWGQGSVEPEEIDDLIADKWFQELELHFDGVSNSFADLFDQVLGDEKIADISSQVEKIASSQSYQLAEELETFFDEVLGVPRARKGSVHLDPRVCEVFDESVSHDALEIGEQISLSTLKLMELDKLDLAKQLRIISACGKKLAAVQKQFDNESRCCNHQLQQLVGVMLEITPEQSKSKHDKARLLTENAQSYAQFRFQEFVLRYSEEYCRAVARNLTSTRTILEKFKNQLEMISSSFEMEDILTHNASDQLNMEQLMLDCILEDREELIEKAEQQVYETLIANRGGFLNVLNETACWQNHLPDAIRVATRSVVADSLTKMSLDKIVAENQVTVEQLLSWLNEMLSLARPSVSNCGGGSRALVGLPRKSQTASLGAAIENQFNVKSTQINGTTGELVFCFEGEDISLANIAYRLLEHRPDVTQLAKRIHTRNDIEWAAIDDIL